MTRTLRSFHSHEQDKVQEWASKIHVAAWHGLYDTMLREEAIIAEYSAGARQQWQFAQETATLTNGSPQYLKPEQRERVRKLLGFGAATEFGQVLATSPVFYSAALRWLIQEHARPPRIV